MKISEFLCFCGSRRRLREVHITQTGDVVVLICVECGLMYDEEMYGMSAVDKALSRLKPNPQAKRG